jgi:hypothetical protein
MARPKKDTANVVYNEPEAVKVPKGFDPSALSLEEQAAVVEEFLGVHPRYFLYKGLNIQLNHGKFRFEGHAFNGWKPASYKYNGFEPEAS